MVDEMEINDAEIKNWSRIGSRATFGQGILKLYEEEPNFFVMSADLGSSSGLARFYAKYPEAFVNVGIAEQNLIGVAAGLAKDGTPVFATSFAPFISMRAGEQIRMNMGYMGLNIKAVGLGSGLAMNTLGSSHYGLEDVAVMRTVPGMTILCPADGLEIVKCIEAAKHHEGPVYFRLTGGTDIIYPTDFEYKIGKANVLREGGNVCIIASGSILSQALQAADILKEQGINATVVDMHTVKPLDTTILEQVSGDELVVTVEEHTVIGGLGSAVAEYYALKKNSPRHLIIGIDDFYPHPGKYEYLLEQCGLSTKRIAEKITAVL
jgi:transketolase